MTQILTQFDAHTFVSRIARHDVEILTRCKAGWRSSWADQLIRQSISWLGLLWSTVLLLSWILWRKKRFQLL